MSMRTLVIGFSCCVILLTACARDGGSFSPPLSSSDDAGELAYHIKAPVDWRPTDISLSCSLNDCPEGVGLLVFAGPQSENSVSLIVCTAFLIAPDQIMTAGHCDQSARLQGFFITRTDLAKPAVRDVSGLLYKQFTRSANPKSISGRLDVAVFQLLHAITNITPYKMASGPPHEYTNLVGYVVNPGPAEHTFTMSIGKLACVVHRNERIFPYNLSELPDMLTVFDCEARPANSGSPMFAEDLSVVEGVIAGTRDLTQKIPFEEPYQSHTDIVASNVRCLNWLGPLAKPCLQVTDQDKQARFERLQDQVLAHISQRLIPQEKAAETNFRPLQLQLNTNPHQAESEYEILYLPTCRTVEQVGNLHFPLEHVRMVFDPWATPKIERLSLLDPPVAILAQTDRSIQVQVNWPQAPGEFVDPHLNPRVQMGSRFTIDLPPCAN
jgi:hypothetical protein